MCVRRGPPFTLVAFDHQRGTNEDGQPLYHMMNLTDLPDHGLIEVPATGSAGMLIRRHVLDELGPPWFENSNGLTIDEDVEFCRKAREAGFRVMIDVDTQIGHIGTIVASPSYQQGQWGLLIDFLGRGENKIFLPGGVRPDGGHHLAVPAEGVIVDAVD